MKKIFVLLFALMSGIISFAQSLEVKGVETKVEIYDGPQYKVACDYADRYMRDYQYKSSTKWFGFSFYNMNSISVSVEAELYQEKNGKLVTIKTFNLKPNETYIWKHENRGADFQVNNNGNSTPWRWTDSKKEPYDHYLMTRYYVKYKAYKIL